MNLLKGIGGFVTSIFGGGVSKDTSELVGDTVRGIGTWIDERDFTPEEKSKANAEMVVRYNQYLDNTIAENTERSKTRRDIAIWIIRLEAFMLVSSILLFRLDPKLSEYIYKIATGEPWGWLVLGVGAFFFGTHMIRGYQSGK